MKPMKPMVKKTISLITSSLIPVIALVTVLLIPFSFIKQGQVRNALDSALHIKVDPVFTGGRIMAKFMDPMGDDFGEGTLTYPSHPAFDGKGYLDVVRYTVNEPVVRGRWTDDLDFWQVGVTLANTANPLDAPGGFTHPVIHIYIDMDGDKGGRFETASPRAELVTFDKAHPWDFMIHIEPYKKKGLIISHDKTYKKPVTLFYVEKKKTVYARIPLDIPQLKLILDGRTTYHYVLVGAYDRLARGNFMAVKKSAGRANGGGAPSFLSPRVYDWVAPPGASQKKQLSSYDESNYQFAQLVPLEVKQIPADEMETLTQKTQKTDTLRLEKVKERLLKEKKKRKSVNHTARIKQLEAKGVNGMELAIAYFEARQLKKAETIFRDLLKKDSSNTAGPLTYLGTLSAMKAGKANSLAKAMENVNEAFALYEKALTACKTDEEMVSLLLNRGNVSISVPEAVFHKSESGAGDFLKAAEILEQVEKKDLKSIINCYYKAAVAYERAGKPEEAEIYFTKLVTYNDLPIQIVAALLERGYNPKFQQ